MTTDASIMEEMLGRATNPETEIMDELAVQMFCMVLRSNSEYVQKAQELIISKIRSTNVTESTKAVAVLEECMSKCGGDFQDEVAKFRFLNDLIRLVSVKYQGPETPNEIKQRIMECLLLWTTEFPEKTKIREVYDMLNKEGGIEHGSSSAVAAKKESILGIDEEMLDKLIKSGDPENYKRANLLIQYRVNQETRRTDLRLQHKSILQEVQNTVALLNQMLDTFNSIDRTQNGDKDNENLMRELYLSCKKNKSIVEHLPEIIENIDEPLTAETLETNDLLQGVMKRYKSIVVHPSTAKTTSSTSEKQTLSSAQSTATSDLLSALIGDIHQNSSAIIANSSKSNNEKTNINTLDELNEIFGTVMGINNPDATQLASNSGDFFGSFDVLEPISVFEQEKKTNVPANNESQPEKKTFRELRDIDALSEELFRKNLPAIDRLGSFKKDPEKLTLNDLAKEKCNLKSGAIKKSTASKENTSEKNKENILTPDSTKQSPVEEATLEIKKEKIDDVCMLVAEDPIVISKNSINQNNESDLVSKTELPIKHLSDITIDLDDVTPKAEEHILLDDDDVKVGLNFTEDRPSRHVSVIVLTVLNKSKMPLKDFHFEASVKKPCKVRLLSPTDTSMAAFKPFRPPTPINQIMLLLNPTGKAIDITCIVGYKLGDDPDPIRESIVAKDIPFVQ